MTSLHLLSLDFAAHGAPPFSEIAGELLGLLETGGESGAVDALDCALKHAAAHGATDVHLEPWEDCSALRFRIDGILHDVAQLPRAHHPRLAARVKILARMVTYQRDLPQDGRIDPEQGGGKAIRVSTFPTVNGERVVLRMMEGADALMQVRSLGFDDSIAERLGNLIRRPQGTLLLTGPSSSGKTTTIYALLRDLLDNRVPAPHVVTIEDPVERRLPGMAQTEIAPHQGFTFEAALRSLLRQDPEVIMVGEIRDADTARTAIQAGLTGHLVVSTIHSGSAAGVFTRLLDMGVEPYLAASSVSGVLAQRLVRRVCEKCAAPYTPDPLLLRTYGMNDFEGSFLRGAGCAACHGIGFHGRTAIGELLCPGESFSELVLKQSRTSVLQELAEREGMRTLLHWGAQYVREGKTTVEELQRVLPPVVS
ncbi:MAG TPA: GspE/PulE family protein [Candidatus Hydrogenedentes bacterium]|nr:GspE/PulE family protein [Candidatus Hydrogenedentota bacterium]